MRIRRLDANPILTPDTTGYRPELGTNINGPSLIRAPDWSADPLGRYYLYFAHHQGDHIRLAYADDVAGPWRVHEPGALRMDQTRFSSHIASPDVHVDEANRRLVMYYHGCCEKDADADWDQPASRAISADGVNWTSEEADLGESYFRVFFHDGWHYAIAKGGRLYRSEDGASRFEDSGIRVDGPWDGRWEGHGRHWAVLRRGRTLHCFFSRWGDAPEHILHGRIDLTRDWRQWRVEQITSVLWHEHEWEGADLPVQPSRVGAVHEPVHELRDPAVYEEAGRVYLFYTVAGERGVAVAEGTGL